MPRLRRSFQAYNVVKLGFVSLLSATMESAMSRSSEGFSDPFSRSFTLGQVMAIRECVNRVLDKANLASPERRELYEAMRLSNDILERHGARKVMDFGGVELVNEENHRPNPCPRCFGQLPGQLIDGVCDQCDHVVNEVA